MSDDAKPAGKPGYASLRRNRWSAAGADYFVTVALRRPAAGLTADSLLGELDRQRRRLESDEGWTVRTWVVMPDHVHILFSLGATVSLAECMRLFKGRLAPALRNHDLHWQTGYYEHRLRPDEDRLPVFLYLFLNPYRAGLLQSDEVWPGYFCAAEDWTWFAPLTRSGMPFPTWLEARSVGA